MHNTSMAQQLSPETLVSRYSAIFDGHSYNIIAGLSTKARPSKVNCGLAQPSNGLLATLPTEILTVIFNFLDFQSISRVSRTCKYASFTVSGLPSYRDMMRHGSEALVALGKTGLIGHHSSSLVHQMLCSDTCVSCFDYGGFMFLPTCERVCLRCLRRSPGFRLMLASTAMSCFQLETEHLKRIPIMRSVPKIWVIAVAGDPEESTNLVSLRQAKELAIEVHGSADKVIKLMPTANASHPLKDFRRIRYYLERPPDDYGTDLFPELHEKALGPDIYGGIASVRFTTLVNGVPERGRICLGCVNIMELIDQSKVPQQILTGLLQPPLKTHHDSIRELSVQQYRLRTKQGQLEHIPHCWGVHQLLEHGHIYRVPYHDSAWDSYFSSYNR